MDDKLKRGLAAAAAVAVLAGGGAAIALASGSGGAGSGAPEAASAEPAETNASGGDDEASGKDDGNGAPVTGSALDRASAIALDRVGGGRVTGTEIRDEEGYYEIEVTRDDGSQLDVHLDQAFNVLDASGDGG